jgi:hypothetical protein
MSADDADVTEWIIADAEEPLEPAPPLPRRRGRRPGRPTKRDTATIQRVAELVGQGMPLKYACDGAGLGYSTLARWRAAPGGKEIEDVLREANARCIETNLAIVRKAAAAGSWQAASFVLERRFPESFGRHLEKHVAQHVTIEHTAQEMAAFTERMERLVPDVTVRRELAVQILRLGEPKPDL